jgi:hypothetical protein
LFFCQLLGFLSHQLGQDRFLCVHPVVRLREQPRIRSVRYIISDLITAVCWKTVKYNRVFSGFTDQL